MGRKRVGVAEPRAIVMEEEEWVVRCGGRFHVAANKVRNEMQFTHAALFHADSTGGYVAQRCKRGQQCHGLVTGGVVCDVLGCCSGLQPSFHALRHVLEETLHPKTICNHGPPM